jgi:uncharacterized protein YhfF
VTETRLDDEAVRALWQEYCAATKVDLSSLDAVERFGDSAEMADQLLGLVLDGRKRATAGLVRDFTAAGEALPEAGGHWVVVDGQGVPRCILRSVEIRLGPLQSVDSSFAWDEGEGDRTRDWWLDAHRRYFTRQCEREGVPFDEQNDLVVFERFEVVWTEQ